MFFRKRTRVPDFLEGRISELQDINRIFIYEDFFNEYKEILSKSGRSRTPGEKGSEEILSADRDLFINSFIGTLLWLIKYRTLGNLFNSPRKLAYLDLTFDTAMPDAVDNGFLRYDTGVIKETYDSMDIGCKKAYTGELLKGDKPRFLISPLWSRDPDPHPFRIAAKLFASMVERESPAGTQEDKTFETFVDMLEERFNEMTQKAAEVAKGLNIT